MNLELRLIFINQITIKLPIQYQTLFCNLSLFILTKKNYRCRFETVWLKSLINFPCALYK